MHLSFDIGSGKFQGRGLPVEAYRARVVHLLQASDRAMLVHHSSDPLDTVVKDILLGVTSSCSSRIFCRSDSPVASPPSLEKGDILCWTFLCHCRRFR